MKVGAPDRDAESGSVQVEVADDASVEISEVELARRCAGGGHPFGQAEGRQHAHAVRRNLETAANGGRLRMGFEDLRRDAGALQEQREGRPGDAAADDDGSMCRVSCVVRLRTRTSFSPVMIHDVNHHERESVSDRPEPVAGPPHGARGAQRHARGRPPARHAVGGEQRARAPSRPAGRPARGAQRPGLVATPRAGELAPLLREVAERLTLTLDRRGFVPEESTRTFTIALADSYQACDVPRIARAFSARLPRASLRVVSADYLAATDGLASGDVDVTFAPAQSVQPGMRSSVLFEERGALVVRRDHPRVRAADDARAVQCVAAHRCPRRARPAGNRPSRGPAPVGGGAPAPAHRAHRALLLDCRDGGGGDRCCRRAPRETRRPCGASAAAEDR